MNVTLPVLRWGTGERRVLLVHGLSSSAQTWWRVASRLAGAGWSVAAPDLRGHGRAPVADSYTFAEMAADLNALGDGWDVVVGHSLGGALAVVAGSSAGWTEQLVLVDPALRISEDRFDAVRDAEIAELEASAVDAILAAHPEWHPEDARLKSLAVRATSAHVIEAIFSDNRPWDFVGALEVLPVPAHVLGADPLAGGIFDPALGLELAEARPHVTYEMAVGHGHSIHRENPTVVVDAVEVVAARPRRPVAS